MEQNLSLETNCSSGRQGFPCKLWDRKFHHCVYKRPLLIPVLNQINSVKVSVLFL